MKFGGTREEFSVQSHTYLERYSAGSNGPIKTIIDACKAGIGNLPFRGGLLGSQGTKEGGSVLHECGGHV